MSATARYVGRFAPSPTGRLHAGSLVAALASWLDARAHGGGWLLRIEDVDRPRCVAGAASAIVQQLADLGLRPDARPWRQSRRGAAYAAALARLVDAGWAYPCGCSRREIEAAQPAARPRGGELVYPGTCRAGVHGRAARAMRMRCSVAPATLARPADPLRVIDWHDRRLGRQTQNLEAAVGDFVLQRADGYWAYQLAVVVDDAEQGITDVVRGEDLADNTPRQIHLQHALGLPRPRYFHTPLVRGADGAKLSKQNGATPIDTGAPLEALRRAGEVLGIASSATSLASWRDDATRQWHDRWAGPRAGHPSCEEPTW